MRNFGLAALAAYCLIELGPPCPECAKSAAQRSPAQPAARGSPTRKDANQGLQQLLVDFETWASGIIRVGTLVCDQKYPIMVKGTCPAPLLGQQSYNVVE
jgi:hypothetical protein